MDTKTAKLTKLSDSENIIHNKLEEMNVILKMFVSYSYSTIAFIFSIYV